MAVTRKFSPNTEIVKVKQRDGFWKHYEVHSSVEGYLRRCKLDGKEAVHVGKTDSKGKLITLFVC